jgi:hypothetical protein
VSGIVSEFYYALFSQRALRILSFDTLPRFEWAFDSPHHVNWTSPPYDPVLYEGLRRWPGDPSYGWPGAASYDGLGINTSQYWPIYHVNELQVATEFFLSDLAAQPVGHADVPHVLFASNRGRTFRLFGNRHYRAFFKRHGMRPESLFACAFDFLFAPNKATRLLMRPYLAALRTARSALVIGIQIRVGDHVFRNDSGTSLDAFSAYFQCAREIEESRLLPGERATWYIISNSLSLRRQARRHYGDKVVTDLQAAPVHAHCITDDPEQCQGGGPSAADAFRQAVSEVLVFRKADVHIVTEASGFGKVGAWLSMRAHSTYSILHYKSRACGVSDYDNPSITSESWQGL